MDGVDCSEGVDIGTEIGVSLAVDVNLDPILANSTKIRVVPPPCIISAAVWIILVPAILTNIVNLFYFPGIRINRGVAWTSM